MNALKHGLRSQAVLLPGDDAAEFAELRRSLFAMYRPLTPVEDRCVERIAACEWRMGRWQRWETGLNAKLDALLTEGPDGTAAQHANPDTHHWQHRSTDCTLQERRLEKSMLATERRLLALQSMRRNRLIAGVGAERPATPASAAGAPGAVSPGAGTLAAPSRAAVDVSGQDAAETPPPATACSSQAIQNSIKQKETAVPELGTPAATEQPNPWNSGAVPENWVVVRRWEPPDGPVGVSSMAPIAMLYPTT
jgi:hypothetical protein